MRFDIRSGIMGPYDDGFIVKLIVVDNLGCRKCKKTSTEFFEKKKFTLK